MQAQGSGNIINISSTYGHEGAARASIYVGAKHAVEGIGEPVAPETGQVREFASMPSRRVPPDTGVPDPLHRHGGKQGGWRQRFRWAASVSPRRFADGIVFIALDEAVFITGHVLNVDGGHSTRTESPFGRGFATPRREIRGFAKDNGPGSGGLRHPRSPAR